MTEHEAESRIKEHHAQKIRCMKLDFRGQKPIDFLKVEVFEEIVSEASFHWMDKWSKDGGRWKNTPEIIDWKKNYIFLLGGLCGIESLPFAREREGKYAFISKANIYRILPSGSRETQSASYEFDAEIRAEEAILKNVVRYNKYVAEKEAGKDPKEVSLRFQTDAEKQLLVVENAKNGAQRADTGAQKRAIIKMLKLPNPSAELIGVHVFCYRCSPNFESAAVRQQYLSHDPTQAVFGGSIGRSQAIDADFSTEPEPPGE